MKESQWIPNRLMATSFGGGMTKSNPKEARPFSSRLAMHVVFKSSLAKGGLRFSKHRAFLKKLIHRQANLHAIQIQQWQIVDKHVHFVIYAKRRKRFHAFLRAFSGLSARYFLNAERGSPRGKKFWDYRPFSRLLEQINYDFYNFTRQNWPKNLPSKWSYILQTMRLLRAIRGPG
tara:strand:- start:6124 stop:6648 length:525 start_codon:yes stop_codon:yes gene_type:complete